MTEADKPKLTVGGHVPAVPVAVYGYCPECGGAGVMRERRPNGDDKCTNGHKYPSSKALAEQPAQQWNAGVPSLYPEPEPGVSIKATYEQPAQPNGCQCPACKIVPHESDCPVHNEPAWPNGPCDCGAQPEQEPSAWRNAALRVGEDLCSVGPFGYYDMTAKQWLDWALSVVTVHAPPARKPWVHATTWRGLTDEEWQEIDASLNGKRDLARIFTRAIEAKLREKNEHREKNV